MTKYTKVPTVDFAEAEAQLVRTSRPTVIYRHARLYTIWFGWLALALPLSEWVASGVDTGCTKPNQVSFVVLGFFGTINTLWFLAGIYGVQERKSRLIVFGSTGTVCACLLVFGSYGASAAWTACGSVVFGSQLLTAGAILRGFGLVYLAFMFVTVYVSIDS